MMQSEVYQLSNRVNLLEVKHGEFNIVLQYINAKLEHIEKLVEENQTLTNSINSQLAARQTRIKTLKATVITMSAIAATLSSLHVKPILTAIQAWLA